MLGDDKSSTPRNTRGSQTTPPANAAQWFVLHQGSRHAQGWKNAIPFHRLRGRGEKGPEDPCRLELTPTARRRKQQRFLLHLLFSRSPPYSPPLLIRFSLP